MGRVHFHFLFVKAVVKQCVSNMRFLIPLWNSELIAVVSVVETVACCLRKTVECALVALSSSDDESSRFCRQWFLLVMMQMLTSRRANKIIAGEHKSRPYSEFSFS